MVSEASEDLLDCLIKADPKYSEGCHEQGSKEGHHRHSIEDGLCRRAKPFRSVLAFPLVGAAAYSCRESCLDRSRMTRTARTASLRMVLASTSTAGAAVGI